MKTTILIMLLIAFLPISNLFTLEVNFAKGTDIMVAENEDEGDDGEIDDESELAQEYNGEDIKKGPEGQATNGKGDMAKPENPPTEESMPKPSDVAPPIEPELSSKPLTPPPPPRGTLKAKKPNKAKSSDKTKSKPKAKPKEKPKVKDKKDKSKSKGKDKAKNGKGMKTVNASCNIRAKADKGAKKLGMLDPGQKIKAEPAGKKWFKISHKGKTAFVSAVCF